MDALILFLLAVVVIAVCLLAMAVGVILRGKSFKSCGCASISFRGEEIRCPGCVDGDSDAEAAEPHPDGCRRVRRTEEEPVADTVR